MAKKLLDDCFLHDKKRMPHAEAIALLRERLSPVTDIAPVALADAGGRVLALPARAHYAVPAHTNSAVDGYAFAHVDYAKSDGAEFGVAGRAAAGHPLAGAIESGRAARILTGAVLPDGVDTVAMQEDCEIIDDDGKAVRRVRIPAGLKRGANVRQAGEDVAGGEILFEAGHVIRPQDLAALASIGLGTVECYRRLRVGIVSTGDEILPAGSRSLDSGEVYDANAPMLNALATLAGCEVEMLGIWPDNAEHVRSRLKEAASRFDVLLTSGGASRGEEDHMASAIDALGHRHMWQIAIKPGRPLMFGQIGDAIVLGLPGNPVAVFVCFLMYGFPMLRRLSGSAFPEPRRYTLPAAFTFENRKLGRREFWRGRAIQTDNGLAAEKYARDGSGLISGLRFADGLIEVGEDVPHVMPGDPVYFIPFSEFGILGGL